MDKSLSAPIAEFAADARCARFMIMNEVLRFATDMGVLLPDLERWTRPTLHEELREGLWELAEMIAAPPPAPPKRAPRTAPKPPLPQFSALGDAVDNPADAPLTRLANHASRLVFDTLLKWEDPTTVRSAAEAMMLVHADGYLRDFAHRTQLWAYQDDLAEKMGYLQLHPEHYFGEDEKKRQRYLETLVRAKAPFPHIRLPQLHLDWLCNSGPRLGPLLAEAAPDQRTPPPNWPIAMPGDGDELPMTVTSRMHRLLRCLSEAYHLQPDEKAELGRRVTIGQLVAHGTLQPQSVFEGIRYGQPSKATHVVSILLYLPQGPLGARVQGRTQGRPRADADSH